MKNNIYLLSDRKEKGAISLPVFEIYSIKSTIDFKKYDALVFTSKNAIYSINSFNTQWKDIPSYAIAPQTASIIKRLGGNLEFVGKKNHGDHFALELLKPLKGKKVLYLRGSKVVSKLYETLTKNDIICDEAIVYESTCKKYNEPFNLPKNSVIIFSSPSTIECFLKNSSWDESFKAIAVGKTTAKYFPEYISAIIADDISIKACIDKALEVIHN